MLVCPACGTGHVRGDGAPPDYWARHSDIEHELGETYWTQARTTVFRGALRRLDDEVGGGRLVDLGGGVGHFSSCALELGWDAYSLDPSDAARTEAARRIGTGRSLSSVPDGFDHTCDAVTLWCVLAHVPDPRAVLARAAALLKPGGRFFLTTPNFLFQAPYAWVLARLGRPIDFVAHDHLLHFTPAGLDLLLHQAGLVAISYTYVGVTEDCVFDRRLARWLVPVKRAWNSVGVGMTRVGLPALSSELQVVGRSRD